MNGFHHVALRVSNFEKSLAFYTEGLGFQQKAAWGEPGNRAVMLNLGDGGCIEIFEGSDALPKGSDGTAVGCWLHLAIKTADSRGMFEKALAAGATVSSEPNDLKVSSLPEPFSATIAFVFGPDGELLEFFQER